VDDVTGHDSPDGPAARIAAAVLAHPDVAALDGGPFGTVVSYLPGRRRVLGVRIGVGEEPVELAVVARHPAPLQPLADELGALVRGLLGPVPVTVRVADVVPAASDGLGDPVTGIPPTVAGPSTPVPLA
jgi:hypothetical protein